MEWTPGMKEIEAKYQAKLKDLEVHPEQDFQIPEGLSAKGKKAAHVIIAELKRQGRFCAGGCKVFYSPKEWKERGEQYGLKSILVVVHDGGDHAGCFNMDYEQYKSCEEMQEALNAIGCFVETATCWYSAVYEG